MKRKTTNHRYLGHLIVLALSAVSIQASASDLFPDFGQAEPVAAVSDPAASDGCPIESPDGLSLAIASTRGDGGDLDIWVSDRLEVGGAWGAPVELPGPVNTAANEFCPTPLGRELYFVSTRPAACSGGNFYRTRQGLSGAWSEPELLPCAPQGPNFNDAVFSPSIVESKEGVFLFYSSFGERGDHDIYVSRQGADGTFGPGLIVHALSNALDDDRMPNLRQLQNGLWEVVFSSNRATWGKDDQLAFGGQDVYRAVAWKLPFVWSVPESVGAGVNTAADETRASLSEDGARLYFGRSGDIFVSERH